MGRSACLHSCKKSYLYLFHLSEIITYETDLWNQLQAFFPFQRLQIDYMDMAAACGYKHSLVIAA